MKPKTKKQNLPKKVKSKPKTKTAEELTAAFLKTPAMVEHTKIIGTVNAQLDPEGHRNRLSSNPQAVPHHAGIRRAQ